MASSENVGVKVFQILEIRQYLVFVNYVFIELVTHLYEQKPHLHRVWLKTFVLPSFLIPV